MVCPATSMQSTWSLSTLHTAPGTQSGRSGRSHACASEAHNHWKSCRHILCSSYQRAACPTTAKNEDDDGQHQVRLPRAPTELPMILISIFRVGQDFAQRNSKLKTETRSLLLCIWKNLYVVYRENLQCLSFRW